MQAHTASIHEHADCLTGLGDSPSETLMVTVLLISLPEPYSPLIISLDIRNLTLLFSVVSMRKHVNFLVLVQLSLQVKILPSMQSASLRRTKRMLHVSGVGRRDTTGTSVRKIWMRMPVESRWRRARSLQQLLQPLQTPIPVIWSGDSGGMATCGHTCARGGMLEIGGGYELGITTTTVQRFQISLLFHILNFLQLLCYIFQINYWVVYTVFFACLH